MRSSFVSGLRRSDHTGENRCWPCTVVNVALVGVAGAALGAVVTPSVGVAVAVGGLALVWLRGYLIPGTPRFAPPLVAAVPGGETLFDKPPRGADEPPNGGGSLGTESAPADPEDLLDRLVETGVLEVGGDTVAPTAAFDERWRAEMDRLRDGTTEKLARAALAISPAAEARTIDDDWIALGPEDGGVTDETWLSRPVAIAELAGYRATEPHLDDDETRLAAARTNRLFLDSCPDCGTALERGTDMSCCGGHTGAGDEPSETLVCPDCEVRLYTYD
ncbi:hypothetical protein SAMN04488067_105105 [Halorubrum xinjiangense]|uniref:Uncharacterized protein n=1 Tax=Halorubrum xinjiangense TaxID=261291 RepID=A0A1G7LVB3_9EURY|nr:hypothetical protein [Halorubrum xinjiangense]SDF52880.1 hypothetical protein SAMN04488067_105105 [Halorubrum xinjiangense]